MPPPGGLAASQATSTPRSEAQSQVVPLRGMAKLEDGSWIFHNTATALQLVTDLLGRRQHYRKQAWANVR
eukprot:6696657-Lingulodinium_polyedra.AAC.1